MADLRIKIGSVDFKNPIFVASGTYGYGTEVSELADITVLGAIVTKSVTRYPREGNPPPRIVETPSGMLNSIGLANIGVEAYIKKMIPLYEELKTPIIMNIAGSTDDEYCEVLELTELVSSNIVGYEINISCPNVNAGGMEFGVDCDLTEQLTTRLRKLTDRLLIMKLSPNVTDIAAIGVAAEKGGADALSAINTLVGMSINTTNKKSNIHYGYGGLSGPAIKPVGLACVHKIYQAVDIPLIGIGGITSADDVLEYVLAGAAAVEVGTANYRDPNIGTSIIVELDTLLDQNDIGSVPEFVGKVELGS
ncbi:Dihydroorotate dehydrogenase, catalytic subunit [hydrothermal vent metagenome]|uniref:Dihydroorotate dehydrogenase, catalytic subunit n=1 Tax=hydrothermal vent metagenome TaxID=652676 RepID=A0A160VHN5_9ZZZZ